MPKLTVERLRELLSYEPETGVFTWKLAPNTRINVGKAAGTLGGQGYLRIKIDGHPHAAHRLAWLYMIGTWPKDTIDHINGVRNDNRFSNLREATRSENLHNTKKRVDNVSGFKGVHWCRNERQWRAGIRVSGRLTNLGYFNTPEEAYAAYCDAAKKLHGEFANVGAFIEARSTLEASDRTGGGK